MRTRFVGPRESYPKRHHDRFIGFAGLTDMTNTRTHGPRKVQTQTETRRVYALRAGDGTLELNKKLCYRRRTARRAVIFSRNLVNCRNKLYDKSATNRSNGVRWLHLIDL